MIIKSRVDYDIAAGIRGPDFSLSEPFITLPSALKYIFTGRIRSLATEGDVDVPAVYRGKRIADNYYGIFTYFANFCKSPDRESVYPIMHYLNHVSDALTGISQLLDAGDPIQEEISKLNRVAKRMRTLIMVPEHINYDSFLDEWYEFCRWCNDIQ
jgi:hypothetical protein